MPRGHRSVRSQGYDRLTPVTTPTIAYYPPISARSLAPSSAMPIQQSYYNTDLPTMSQQYQSYATGGPVQHPPASQHLHQYSQLPMPQPVQQPMSIRPSSGAWNPNDDHTLMKARAQGMNWAPIQQSYFPTKTPNACRKRHERLMERRSADDWDGLKLENLSKNYMTMRREIWQGLASATGEKWNVVEAKCMSQGLKNLQTSARSAARRDRMLDTSLSSSFDDRVHDSGISIESDLVGEDYADGASEHSGHSATQGYYEHQSHGSTSSSRHSGGGYSASGNYSTQMSGGQRQGRVSSMDMGIGAIINRHDGR